MFTGLIQDIGTLERLTPGPMAELWVQSAVLAREPYVLGESIAVNGCCLTVVEARGPGFRVDAAPETLRRTSLGDFKVGQGVNLERAMRLSDRLGGHLVQGHVDGVSRLLSKRTEGGSLVLDFELPPDLAAFLIEKGSIAIDGVSLTVNALAGLSFSVQLIPETQRRTTLASRAVGERVNLEADLIGKYVARLAAATQPR